MRPRAYTPLTRAPLDALYELAREARNAVAILRFALTKMGEGRGWCRGAWARDGTGTPIPPWVGASWAPACSWCLAAALVKARPVLATSVGREPAFQAFELAQSTLLARLPKRLVSTHGNGAIHHWNDARRRKFCEVASLVTDAILELDPVGKVAA